MAHGAKGNGQGKPGPKPDVEKMVLALHLHLQGEPWTKVSKAIGVAYRTLMRWQTRDDWREVCDKFAPGHIGQLERGAFAVLARRLYVELRKRDPDISIAERVLKVVRPQAGEDGEYAGAGFGPGAVVLLPMESKGLESLQTKKLIKRGAKDKESGNYRYSVSKAGEKHLSTPASPKE